MSSETIQRVAETIRQAQLVGVLTGAGVSKESGVPTFRDAQTGLWAKYDPQQLATPTAFKQNPKLVWDWYQFRRDLVSEAKPNPGHIALAELENYVPTIEVITQNVDDLHEQAGSTSVTHLHGKIARTKCFDDCQGDPTVIDLTTIEYEETPPVCPHCGAYLRPDVVWFGEILPTHALDHAKAISHQCDVMLVVGTSGLVTPAATLPSYARQAGATIIEINPDYSMITRIADLKLEGPSGEMLPQVIEVLK